MKKPYKTLLIILAVVAIEQSASYHEKGLAWLEETKSALCT